MKDKTTTIAELKSYIQDFSAKRGWCGQENAKNLAMALTVEAAELSEIFMWLHSDEADSVKNNIETYQHLQDELADILWYVCRIACHFDVDLATAVVKKGIKNAAKYPVLP